MGKFEIRAVIKYLCKKGLSSKEIHNGMAEVFVEIIPNIANKYLTEIRRDLAHLSENEDDFDIEEGDDEENGLVFLNNVNKVGITEDDSQRDEVNTEQRVDEEDQQSAKEENLENQITRNPKKEGKELKEKYTNIIIWGKENLKLNDDGVDFRGVTNLSWDSKKAENSQLQTAQ
ncbi:hypothetical protein ILUMI_12389 [Ignelater luminosus]|uniref:Uncharacterized protein n=1 Tax=Ignelater luminosus TaxID=2038154 RepID=A0A8K0D2Y6_IGNLU|nr:hypothetical protein ILUMI_12389 [Ignelater luminosus]